jgi:hypothetical protein
MSSSFVSRTMVLGALAMGVGHAVAADRCVPVSGRITNNFASQNATLGVIAMAYGDKASAIKLKCAMSGAAQTGVAADIAFIHSITCDDAIDGQAFDGSGPVPVHSSIVLFSTGTIYPPQSPSQLFTFKEVSRPIPSVPARGLFQGVSSGEIQVDGTVYKGTDSSAPAGSIDMQFTGKVCYPA